MLVATMVQLAMALTAGAGQDKEGISSFHGSCAPGSFTYVGAPAEAKRTDYGCTAVIWVVLPDIGHQQFIFLRQGEEKSMLSFGGYLDAERNLKVARIQFELKVSTAVDGACRIQRDGAELKAIACAAKALDGSERSAKIDFTATGRAI